MFLLTDDEPELLAGGPGLTVQRSEQASSSLLADLRSDVGMEWVPSDMWLSYLQLDASAGDLDYDLAASADRTGEPSITDAGVGPAAVVAVRPPAPATPWWPVAAGIAAGLAILVAWTAVVRRRAGGLAQ